MSRAAGCASTVGITRCGASGALSTTAAHFADLNAREVPHERRQDPQKGRDLR